MICTSTEKLAEQLDLLLIFFVLVHLITYLFISLYFPFYPTVSFLIFELRENPLPSNKRKMIATKMICYVICLETAHVASIIVEEQKEGMYYIFLKTIFRPFLFDFCSNLVFICNTKSQIAFLEL